MNSIMNIYLDVDGVILDKHLKPSACLHEFIEYVTSHHTCYWATTHVVDGTTGHLFVYLRRNGVPEETLELLGQIRGTTWDVLKTEVIDFTTDFLWFEDMPTDQERKALKQHKAADKLVWVDREQGDGLCKWIQAQKGSEDLDSGPSDEVVLDNHEKRMSQFTADDIERMSDIEVLSCVNLSVEGEPTTGIVLSGTYFSSQQESIAVAKVVVRRAREIYTADPENYEKKFIDAQNHSRQTVIKKASWFERYFALCYYVPLVMLYIGPLLYFNVFSNFESSDIDLDIKLDPEENVVLPDLPKLPSLPKLPANTPFSKDENEMQPRVNTFMGYPCTDDCSGHKAGYAWAEDNDITNPDDCGGNSNSFIEGCMAWAEVQ